MGLKDGMHDVRLIGDIGGTNARFAIATHGRFNRLKTLSVTDYPSLQEAIGAYVATIPDDERPTSGALAVAGPVTEDEVALTNRSWSFSIAKLGADLGLAPFVVVNDFSGTAMAIPHLPEAGRYRIGPDIPTAKGPIGIIGPGTGLGISAIVPVGKLWILVPGEGGHATMPASTDDESRVLDILRARWTHVSAERVLSGAGLVNLYQTLADLAGRASLALSPADVTDRATSGEDQDCVDAFDMFCAMLGTVAGNLALTVGATGGIYIAGGILPRFKEGLQASRFRASFENKGRLDNYLKDIPTFLVLEDLPALHGLANFPLDPVGPRRRIAPRLVP